MPIATPPAGTTGLLVLADGEVFAGAGLGRAGVATGELCFNTAMTGYQEILTDPSYMGQIVTFTFPHIGNVGANGEDLEQLEGGGAAALGAVFREAPTPASNWRARWGLDAWLADRGLVGLAGVDTRALTRRIRERGMPQAVVAHAPDGRFDIPALIAQARDWSGIDGADLALPASSGAPSAWEEGLWSWGRGYGSGDGGPPEVVVVDYGVKRNILRALTAAGAKVAVVPATTSAAAILSRRPRGVVLANGPGDPAATARWAAPEIRALVASGVPVLGICLGHQLLALSLGAETAKMEQGHHGANHPVKDLATGKVEIVSMNHGFTVRRESLPADLEETHVSLFDGSNAGLKVKDRPVFSVQHHPEASPGPTDSLGVFAKFLAMTAERAASRG